MPSVLTLFTHRFSGRPKNIYLEDLAFEDAVIAQGSESFDGDFNGRGNRVVNLTINSSENSSVGLFGYTGEGATVRNVGIENCSVNASTQSKVAALAGQHSGTIENCYVTGSVSGQSWVGAIAGDNNGNIINSFSIADISAQYFYGGIAGANNGTLRYCYAAGPVAAGGMASGGLTGSNNLLVDSCFWDADATGQTVGDGGSGKSTAQMTIQTTYTDEGWDFSDSGVWVMSESDSPFEGYPAIKPYVEPVNPITLSGLSARQIPGTKKIEITYDVDNSAGNTADVALAVSNGTQSVACPGVSGDIGLGVAEGTNKSIIWNAGADWSGNIAELTFAITVERSPDSVSLAVSTGVDTRDYNLNVISAHGVPVPSGMNTYAWGTNLTLSVGSDADYTCAGWSGTGCVPSQGSASSVIVTLTNHVNSSITWNWALNSYDVTFSVGENGTRTGGGALVQDVVSGGAAELPNIVAKEGWVFVEWAVSPFGASLSNVREDIHATAVYRESIPDTLQVQYEKFKLMSVDGLGDSVAVWGDIAASGAASDHPNGEFSGSVSLFDVQTGTFVQTCYPDDGNEWDWFGGAVAVHGSNLLAGAWWEDTGGEDAGAAHLFNAQTGEHIRRLLPGSADPFDYFGFSVALDDQYAVVGGYNDDSRGTKPGRVFVYSLADEQVEQELIPLDGSGGDSFGWSVSIDNGIVAVGAPTADPKGSSSGAVYLFDVGTGVQLMKIVPEDGAENHQFGYDVSLSDGKLLASAPDSRSFIAGLGSAYLYDIVSGAQIHKIASPPELQTIYFGCSVAMDGPRVLIGCYSDEYGTGGGAACLYDTDSGELIRCLIPSDGDPDDEFGGSVALYQDTAVVSAEWHSNYKGAVYLFDLSDWSQPPSGLDTDEDGIPDEWEKTHFGSATGADPSAISSNGINTVRECYIAGISPNDPQAFFKATCSSEATAGFVFSWNTQSGRVYSVWQSTNLMSGFQCLESNLPWTVSSYTNADDLSGAYFKVDVEME